MKVISKLGLEPKAVISLQDEIALQQSASSDAHPNIIKLHNVIDSVSSLYLVSTYCACGDLFEQIISSSEHGFPISRDKETIRSIILQLIEGVAYLHDERGIAHRDLKPENLYWDASADEGRGRLLIGDFGLASQGRYASDFGNGTSFYASPDAVGYFRNIAAKETLTRSVRSKKGYRSPKQEDDPRQYRYDAFASDVWSIGIIFINLACERNPWQYASANDEAFLAYVAHPDTFLLSILPDLTPECHTLLKGILKLQPEQRLGLAEMHAAILKLEAFTTVQEGSSLKHKNSWIEMGSSKDSCRSISLSDSGPTTGPSAPQWLTAAPSPSEAFYTLESPVEICYAEYRFPPSGSAPVLLSSREGSAHAVVSPVSAPCSLTLSASTEGSEEVVTPAVEVADPLLAFASATVAATAATKQPAVLFPLVVPTPGDMGALAHSKEAVSKSAAPVLALPLPPSRSPRPLLSPLFSPSGISLRSPVTFSSNVPQTPRTPNFTFNPSPNIMTSPLRHAQQAFLEKHYVQYGGRRGSLPVASDRRESAPSFALPSAGVGARVGGLHDHRRGSRPILH